MQIKTNVTEEDLTKMVKEVHSRDIKLLIKYMIISLMAYIIVALSQKNYVGSFFLGINTFFVLKIFVFSKKVYNSLKVVKPMTTSKVITTYEYVSLTGFMFCLINIIFIVLGIMKIL